MYELSLTRYFYISLLTCENKTTRTGSTVMHVNRNLSNIHHIGEYICNSGFLKDFVGPGRVETFD